MLKKSVPRLAGGELEILQMLWREDAVTIAQAQQALGLPIGYTTVQTRLNRLVKKKVVERSTTRPATYLAMVTQDQVRSVDLDILVERVSEGRITPLVAQLMNRKGITREEIDEIKSLLAAAEKNTRQKGKSRG